MHCNLTADSCRGTGLILRLADCQRPTWRVWSRLRLLILLPWLIFAACSDSDGSDALIVAGLDGQEPELVRYLDSLRQAVRAQPRSGSIRGHLAMAYDANGFARAAEVTYTQAQALDPEDFRWPYFRATALATLGDYPDALQSLDRALAIDSSYPPAWLWRGAWLLDLDRYEEAGAAYDRAAQYAGDLVSAAAATVGSARVLLRQERTIEALELLEKLTADSPHPSVVRLLRTAYRRLGRASELPPIDQSDTATALTWPDARQGEKSRYVRGFSGRLLIAEKMLRDQEVREALKILEPLRDNAPDDRDLLNNLSIAYKLNRQPAEAFAVLLHGLEVHADFQLFHFNIAVIYEDRGEDGLALDHLDRALEIAPDLLAAHERKFDLLIRRSRFNEALAAFEDAARYGQAQGGRFLDVGMVAGALERWPLAIEHFEQALALEPQLVRANLFLGLALAQDGRFNAARAALTKADQLGVDPDDIAAARLRLDTLEQSQ